VIALVRTIRRTGLPSALNNAAIAALIAATTAGEALIDDDCAKNAGDRTYPRLNPALARQSRRLRYLALWGAQHYGPLGIPSRASPFGRERTGGASDVPQNIRGGCGARQAA
jgi:hypothetical protein